MKTELSEKERRDLTRALLFEIEKANLPDGVSHVEFVSGNCEKFSEYEIFIVKSTKQVPKCL